MPTEHSGGSPHIGFESSSSPKGGECSVPVATADFDYSALDSDEELLTECVHLDVDMRPRLHKIIERAVALGRADAVSATIILILDSDNPRAMAMQVDWATGGYVSSGISMPQIAKELGISKQAFQQRDRRIHEMLDLRKTRCMRSQEAKDNMRRAYKGKGKTKSKSLFTFNLRSSALSMVRYLRQQVLASPIPTWPKPRRSAMRLELQPIIDIHSQL